MTDTPDTPEWATGRALVGRLVGLLLHEKEKEAGDLLADLEAEELRYLAGAAIEHVAALAIGSFGSKEAAMHYAEVVWLSAAASTPEPPPEGKHSP